MMKKLLALIALVLVVGAGYWFVRTDAAPRAADEMAALLRAVPESPALLVGFYNDENILAALEKTEGYDRVWAALEDGVLAVDLREATDTLVSEDAKKFADSLVGGKNPVRFLKTLLDGRLKAAICYIERFDAAQEGGADFLIAMALKDVANFEDALREATHAEAFETDTHTTAYALGNVVVCVDGNRVITAANARVLNAFLKRLSAPEGARGVLDNPRYQKLAACHPRAQFVAFCDTAAVTLPLDAQARAAFDAADAVWGFSAAKAFGYFVSAVSPEYAVGSLDALFEGESLLYTLCAQSVIADSSPLHVAPADAVFASGIVVPEFTQTICARLDAAYGASTAYRAVRNAPEFAALNGNLKMLYFSCGTPDFSNLKAVDLPPMTLVAQCVDLERFLALPSVGGTLEMLFQKSDVAGARVYSLPMIPNVSDKPVHIVVCAEKNQLAITNRAPEACVTLLRGNAPSLADNQTVRAQFRELGTAAFAKSYENYKAMVTTFARALQIAATEELALQAAQDDTAADTSCLPMADVFATLSQAFERCDIVIGATAVDGILSWEWRIQSKVDYVKIAEALASVKSAAPSPAPANASTSAPASAPAAR